jgi:hypothetical protein
VNGWLQLHWRQSMPVIRSASACCTHACTNASPFPTSHCMSNMHDNMPLPDAAGPGGQGCFWGACSLQPAQQCLWVRSTLHVRESPKQLYKHGTLSQEYWSWTSTRYAAAARVWDAGC